MGGGGRALLVRRVGGTEAGLAGARRPRPALLSCAMYRGRGSLSALNETPTALKIIFKHNYTHDTFIRDGDN